MGYSSRRYSQIIELPTDEAGRSSIVIHEGHQGPGVLVLYTTLMYNIESDFAFPATDEANCAANFEVLETSKKIPSNRM